jgi:multidrug efflux pump subunit AcrA (membrane-fusion protein)
VEKNGVAEWRPVELGAIVRDQVVVTSGVEAGDHVVINGHRSLVQGDPLIISRQGVCCEAGRAVFEEGK